jgi:YidC/Oxa1 family membrane protein insertase
MQQQQRFLLFIAISIAILYGWTYFFPAKNPQQNANNANVAAQQQQAQPSPSATAAPVVQQQNPSQQQSAQNNSAPAPESVQHRQVKIQTPLYTATFDNQGAVATSWILEKNKQNGQAFHSVGGTKKDQLPLELIPKEGVDPSFAGLPANDREAPFRLVTGDQAIDSALANKNYSIAGADSDTIQVGNGQTRTVEFKMHDDVTGVDAIKKLTFRGDNYNVQVETNLTKNGQPLPQAKIAIGPSIGDQGVPKYTFYSYAPEGVASVNNSPERFNAKAINEAKNNPNQQSVPGNVDWASVGDTYFSMVAVPSKPASGLEYKTTKYDNPANKKETRYLITGYMPVSTDGAPMAVYVGPKDHGLLQAAAANINSEIHSQVDFDGLFNYGWFATVKKALAFPILASINWLEKLTGSYGLAIILFTIVLYSLFFPLKWRSSKSMKKAQKLAPRMKELQEKMKGMKQNDPRLKELQMEQLRLMKEGNPLGGCLPLLIQMPFLFALYSAITISIDFRQAPFLWMPDLSAGDPFHILEILMAASMVVLQLVTPAPSADPLQRKMMAFTMPAMMLWLLWGAPSGLVVYWLVGNIVGFSQQFLINHLTKSKDDDASPQTPVSSPTTKKKSKPPRPVEA